MRENKFQELLISELYELFPGCMVIVNDENYIQGIPDILILYKKNWAMLECKRSANASYRPNQKYYISILDKMSFCTTIYPENKEEVLNELQRALQS